MIIMHTQLLPKEGIWNATARRSVVRLTGRDDFFTDKASCIAIAAASDGQQARFNVCNQEGH
jgi:hypothetical protein